MDPSPNPGDQEDPKQAKPEPEDPELGESEQEQMDREDKQKQEEAKSPEAGLTPRRGKRSSKSPGSPSKTDEKEKTSPGALEKSPTSKEGRSLTPNPDGTPACETPTGDTSSPPEASSSTPSGTLPSPAAAAERQPDTEASAEASAQAGSGEPSPTESSGELIESDTSGPDSGCKTSEGADFTSSGQDEALASTVEPNDSLEPAVGSEGGVVPPIRPSASPSSVEASVEYPPTPTSTPRSEQSGSRASAQFPISREAHVLDEEVSTLSSLVESAERDLHQVRQIPFSASLPGAVHAEGASGSPSAQCLPASCFHLPAVPATVGPDSSGQASYVILRPMDDDASVTGDSSVACDSDAQTSETPDRSHLSTNPPHLSTEIPVSSPSAPVSSGIDTEKSLRSPEADRSSDSTAQASASIPPSAEQPSGEVVSDSTPTPPSPEQPSGEVVSESTPTPPAAEQQVASDFASSPQASLPPDVVAHSLSLPSSLSVLPGSLTAPAIASAMEQITSSDSPVSAGAPRVGILPEAGTLPQLPMYRVPPKYSEESSESLEWAEAREDSSVKRGDGQTPEVQPVLGDQPALDDQGTGEERDAQPRQQQQQQLPAGTLQRQGTPEAEGEVFGPEVQNAQTFFRRSGEGGGRGRETAEAVQGSSPINTSLESYLREHSPTKERKNRSSRISSRQDGERRRCLRQREAAWGMSRLTASPSQDPRPESPPPFVSDAQEEEAVIPPERQSTRDEPEQPGNRSRQAGRQVPGGSRGAQGLGPTPPGDFPRGISDLGFPLPGNLGDSSSESSEWTEQAYKSYRETSRRTAASKRAKPQPHSAGPSRDTATPRPSSSPRNKAGGGSLSRSRSQMQAFPPPHPPQRGASSSALLSFSAIELLSRSPYRERMQGALQPLNIPSQGLVERASASTQTSIPRESPDDKSDSPQPSTPDSEPGERTASSSTQTSSGLQSRGQTPGRDISTSTAPREASRSSTTPDPQGTLPTDAAGARRARTPGTPRTPQDPSKSQKGRGASRGTPRDDTGGARGPDSDTPKKSSSRHHSPPPRPIPRRTPDKPAWKP